jgi:hypothetical protein
MEDEEYNSGLNSKNICQSCGMPMKQEEDQGSDELGCRSEDYCKFCFQNGKFVDEGISLNGKIDKLVEMGVSQLGMSEEMAREMAEVKLHGLKRWRG